MINKITSRALTVLGLALVLVGCVRNDDFFDKATGEPNSRMTVKFVNAGDVIQRARNVAPTIDTFVLIELRRDPRSEAETNSPLTVKLLNDTSVIGKYNRANRTSYEQLPSSLYTLIGTDLNAITFAPGEVEKRIRIRLDKTNLDLSKQYALGFSVVDPGTGAKVSATQGSVLYAVGVKNKYDGKYTATGTMVDYANSSLTGYYPWNVEFRTSGPNSVVLYDAEVIGGVFHPILSGGSLSYYGQFGVQLTFDPVTNRVVSVTNVYGQPSGNGRSAELDPSGMNAWDPSSRDVQVKYWMNQPTVIQPHRVAFDESFEYQGPR